jgi:hypothetical protein
VIAPAAHASLFVVASLLMWISDQRILGGPALVPFVILFVADAPFSTIAFGEMLTSAKHAWPAWVLWGVLGTVWWYLLGLSIEAWIRRFSGRRTPPKR